MIRASFCAFGLLCVLPACGDDGGNDACAPGAAGSPAVTPEVLCDASNTPTDPTALIDDLEDQNGLLAPVDGRSGGWWVAGDETLGATLSPASSDTTPTPPEQIPNGGRCGSRYAMHMTGQGFNDWGSLLGLSFAYGSSGALLYDASRHQGIRFWARVGDTSVNRMRVQFADVNNEPAGGKCVVGGLMQDACYDTFLANITDLDVKWKRYQIPFAGLAQRNFGLPADGPATDALYGVQFAFEGGAVFDLWIDDIEFY